MKTYNKGRNSKDGKPYYCSECGCGYDEYLACELPFCKLETNKEAEKRRLEDEKSRSKRQAQVRSIVECQ